MVVCIRDALTLPVLGRERRKLFNEENGVVALRDKKKIMGKTEGERSKR